MKRSDIKAIDDAKAAASEGDRSAVAGYLAKTGRWALDTATKIGVPVTVEALKRML